MPGFFFVATLLLTAADSYSGSGRPTERHSTCVCGDRDSFIREQRRFESAFPGVIRKKHDASGIRFHCHSG